MNEFVVVELKLKILTDEDLEFEIYLLIVIRAEHDRQSMHNELVNTRTACDQLSREKVICYVMIPSTINVIHATLLTIHTPSMVDSP